MTEDDIHELIGYLRGSPADRKFGFDKFESDWKPAIVDKLTGHQIYKKMSRIIHEQAPDVALKEFRTRFWPLLHTDVREAADAAIAKAAVSETIKHARMSPRAIRKSEEEARANSKLSYDERQELERYRRAATRPWWKFW